MNAQPPYMGFCGSKLGVRALTCRLPFKNSWRKVRLLPLASGNSQDKIFPLYGLQPVSFLPPLNVGSSPGYALYVTG